MTVPQAYSGSRSGLRADELVQAGEPAWRETYTVSGAVVHRTPSTSQASQKIARMSAERLLNEYRGERQLRPLFMNRQPSDWMSPRSSRSGWRPTSAFCQSNSAMRRRCFTPGPCWGKICGQCFEYA